VVARDDGRLDDGDRVGQVEQRLGRRRQQRDERADRDDVDDKRRHDAVAPEQRASAAARPPRRHGNAHLLTAPPTRRLARAPSSQTSCKQRQSAVKTSRRSPLTIVVTNLEK